MVKNLSLEKYLDLRGFLCPVNFVKCCLALESLSVNDYLKVDLDRGESESTVIEGLKEKGYKVKLLNKDSKMVSILIHNELKPI